MAGQEAEQKTDEVLLPFLRAADPAEAEHLLASLISEQADQVARPIIAYKMYAFAGRIHLSLDAEDVYSEVILRLLGRLQLLRTDPGAQPISSFRAYVKGLTLNVCSEYLRKRFPNRSGLQDKVRYLLTHSSELAMWKSEEHEWLCGSARWRVQQRMAAGAADLEQLRRVDLGSLAPVAHPRQDVRRQQLAEMLSAIFSRLDGPIALDDLVGFVAELQGIKDETAHYGVGHTDQPQVRDQRADAEVELSQRRELERLWTEIRLLPARQRFALLMNLTDAHGEDVTGLLPLTGICTFSEIAEALSLTVELFAEIAKELPLEDTAIAVRLGCTRQQVINLRKSARERLARRLRDFGR
jgi:RNA polymerase sigma factor (sigma-70 family)